MLNYDGLRFVGRLLLQKRRNTGMDYFSLHLHTIKSIGDSIVTIDGLIKKAKEYDLPALAVTNHGTMSDSFEFYKACKKEGIKPIIGCEIYVRRDDDETKYHHLVLIAKNRNGYKNLLKIHNYGQLEGFYRKPIVDDWVLQTYGSDIIALSACVGGSIPQLILKACNTETEEASQIIFEEILQKINNYKSYFDEFYLEVQPGNFNEQCIVNEYLKYFSEVTDTPLIITNDVHYLDKEDYKIHNVHVVAERKNSDVSKLVYPDTCYYFMNNHDIYEAINLDREIIDVCIKNIYHIVEQIEDYELLPEHINMPVFVVPEDYNEDSYLEKICLERLELITMYIQDPAEYIERLIVELDTIAELKFSGYFLVVRDYIKYATEHGIEVGPGRGSVCGSLVAFLCDITKVDPIRFGLLFERFLSTHRKEVPDIDVDFASDGRDDVFDYVVNKYGKENCALVSTFSLRKSRSALKDTGRVYQTLYEDLTPEVYDYVAKLIPETYYYDDEDGNSEKKTDLSIEESIEIVPELREYADKYPLWFEAAIKLSNLPKATSVHAAGTLISPVPLGDYIPLVRSKHDKIDATALNLKDAETAGFIKYDFLSLATLGITKKLKNMLSFSNIYNFVGDGYDDPVVWNVIGSKYTAGLFQIGSPTYRQRMGRLSPKTIDELAACLALVRGPCISSKADEHYMKIVEGKEEIELLHPIYDEVTKETNGVLLYQEQFMNIFYKMGFSMEESYTAMKAAAKKKMDVLKEYEERFMEKAKRNNMSDVIADRIFKILVDTGLYSFNKSHAVAYAILCYITAYLKVYHPKEFLAASLTNAYERKEEVKDLIADCRRLGISFLPLDINNSNWEFTVEDDCLRIGFSALKSFGAKAYDELIAHRPVQSLQGLYESVTKQKFNKKCFVASIFSGALDSLCDGKTRDSIFKEYCEISKNDFVEYFTVQGITGDISIYNSVSEFEDTFYGIMLTSDPINDFESIEIDSILNGSCFNIVGIYGKIKKHKTKTKQESMAFATIRTGDGEIDITIFPKQYEEYKKIIRKNLVCVFNLRKQTDDSFIVNNIKLA